MELAEIRRRIDLLDGEIVTLFSKRAELASAAGRLKNAEYDVPLPRRVLLLIFH